MIVFGFTTHTLARIQRTGLGNGLKLMNDVKGLTATQAFPNVPRLHFTITTSDRFMPKFHETDLFARLLHTT